MRVQSYETAMKDSRNQQAEISANTNSVALNRAHVMVLIDGSGVHLVADGQLQLLDTQALLGGPWIYYLNDAEPFRQIQVPAENVQEFVSDLTNLTPPEFAEKWCANQPAAELLSDFIPSED